MGVEAFLWNYREGKPIGFDFATVRDILVTDGADWSAEAGRLRVRFCNPDDSVDIFLGKEAPATNHADGILVSRPIRHPDFLRRVFRVMELGDVMFFYSDDTTPVFIRGADAGQYPADLLRELGTPRYIESPSQLLHPI